ncbi:MAG: FHA domain-containing protein [Propionibacteriaceae bacterium]|jgi:pSer/pThr/pTyr-binding forkhead associated (FHA) protein|nr:FHA domain-containing protein [Propionibacteriaceae bacterium]
MSELVIVGLKLGFLALLWLFILFTGNVVRTDLFGRKVNPAELSGKKPTRKERKARKGWPKAVKVTHGAQAGTVVELGEGILIGRSADCQLNLDDDYVSTKHARIMRGQDGYILEDLGSTNGTFVNNARISAPTPFALGDTLRIGRTLLSVEK